LEPNFDKIGEFPIGFYVKLSSAVAAILVGGMKCRTQFWKGTTQGSSQQSLASPQKPLGQLQLNFGGIVFGYPPSNLCPVIPTSNQDGHQAKNRKKGDEI
jgi:hypothetical protein